MSVSILGGRVTAGKMNEDGQEDFRCDDDDDGQLIRVIFTW
jgi:hypothetical protein